MPSLPGNNLLPESKARPSTSAADPKPKPKFRRLGAASAASVAPSIPSFSSTSSSSVFAAFTHALSRAPPTPLIALITVISTALLFHVFTANTATTSPAALARSPSSSVSLSVSAIGSVPLTTRVRDNDRQPSRPAVTVVRRTTRKILNHVYAHDHDGTHPDFRRLVVYNRPPQPGSVAVSRALSSEARRRGLSTSRCFVRPELNAMALRTILNNNKGTSSSPQQQQRVDVYTCRLQLSKARYRALQEQRGHNVTFMTSTVDPVVMVTASYLEQVFSTAAGKNASEWILKVLSSSSTLSDERNSNSSGTGKNVYTTVIKGFRAFMKRFPVGALYDFHGADEDFALTECPTRYEQMASLRRVVSRYEAVIDLDRPAESVALVDIVTDGALTPDFDTATTAATTTALMLRQTKYREHPLISGLLQVAQNLSSTHLCGHQLVHGMLVQQFNLIKDRLLQNRCFDEDIGTFRLCELMPLHRNNMRERTRDESFAVKDELAEQLKRATTN